MAQTKQTVFGIAMRNFTKYPEMPSAKELIDYGVRMEELGYESLWAWDHILLGVDPNFPIHEALTILTAVAARTSKIKVGTGILVMPMRNPVILAKELATIDHISDGRLIVGAAVGWYKREFNSMGVDFHQRGKIMEQGLEIISRLWTEEKVDGDYPPYKLRGAVLYPKPVQKPRPPILIGGYVDAVLKRAGTKGDGWLTYYYTPESFTRVWGKVRRFAEEAGRNPDELISTNQLPICIGERAKIEAPMKHWLQTEWDYASWSESTMESAIMGTRRGVHRAARAAYRGRRRPHHLRPLQVREGAGGGRCPADHPAAQKRGEVARIARGLQRLHLVRRPPFTLGSAPVRRSRSGTTRLPTCRFAAKGDSHDIAYSESPARRAGGHAPGRGRPGPGHHQDRRHAAADRRVRR